MGNLDNTETLMATFIILYYVYNHRHANGNFQFSSINKRLSRLYGSRESEMSTFFFFFFLVLNVAKQMYIGFTITMRAVFPPV